MINIANTIKTKTILSEIIKRDKIYKNDMIIVISSDNILDFVRYVRKNYIPFFHYDKIVYEDSFEYEKEKLFEKANAKFIYVIYLEKRHYGCYPSFKATVYNDMRPSYFKANNIIIYDKFKSFSNKNMYINTKSLFKEVYKID